MDEGGASLAEGLLDETVDALDHGREGALEQLGDSFGVLLKVDEGLHFLERPVGETHPLELTDVGI